MTMDSMDVSSGTVLAPVHVHITCNDPHLREFHPPTTAGIVQVSFVCSRSVATAEAICPACRLSHSEDSTVAEGNWEGAAPCMQTAFCEPSISYQIQHSARALVLTHGPQALEHAARTCRLLSWTRSAATLSINRSVPSGCRPANTFTVSACYAKHLR